MNRSVIVLSILAWITVTCLTSCNYSTPSLPQSLVSEVNIQPVWHEEVDSPNLIPQNSTDFYLFWDRSIPMGGYLHPTHPDSQFILSKVQELIKNERLESDYGSDPNLKCMGITNLITSIDCDDNILRTRGFFNGGESQINKGIELVLSGLMSGDIKGAALITDLMTTTDYGLGATGLLPYFRDPLLANYFNHGKIHFGILRVRLNYWGVHSGSCQADSGPVGCWFHEGQQRYVMLDDAVQRPIYVLIFGRSLGIDDRKTNSINTIAMGLKESLNSLGFDAEYEPITLGGLGLKANFLWNSSGEGYQPVVLDPNKGYSCLEGGSHIISGEFEDSLIQIQEFPLDIFDGLGAFSQLMKVGGNGIQLRIDCEFLRRKIRDEGAVSSSDSSKVCNNDGVVRQDLSEVSARILHDPQSLSVWDMWSSLEHSPDLTLYLKGFIEGLQPGHHVATISPVPPINCS